MLHYFNVVVAKGFYKGGHQQLPLGPWDISRCFDLGWVWTFSYPR